jgi:hypothetical protein
MQPRLVSPVGKLIPWLEETTPKADEAAAVERIRGGDLDMPITASTVSAYVRVSEVVEEWAMVAAESVEVGPPGVTPHGIELLRTAGFETIAGLDRAVQKARLWAARFLRQYRLAVNERHKSLGLPDGKVSMARGCNSPGDRPGERPGGVSRSRNPSALVFGG